jgi:hypothetical protein
MPSQAVVVSLPPDALPALRLVARDEYRTPQAQAAWLVLEGLQRRGALAAALSPAQDLAPDAETSRAVG